MKKLIGFYIWLSLGAHAFTQGSNLNLASSPEAAKYRTGIIDPVVEKVPASIQNANADVPETYIKNLVEYLVKDASNDYVKVKRFYDWITLNIAYDDDYFNGTGTKPVLLKDKRTTCGGFADLMLQMCKASKIECLTIPGRSRVTWNPEKKEMASHAWNAVKIDSKWHLVDPTRGNRCSYKNGKLGEKEKYSDSQLFVSAQAKIIDNFPNNETYQFLDKPITYESFLQFPKVSMYYYTRFGVKFIGEMKNIVTKEYVAVEGRKYQKVQDVVHVGTEPVVIKFKTPANVALFSKITDKSGKVYENFTTCYVKGDTTFCVFSAPAKGNFEAYISGKMLPDDNVFNRMYEFTLAGDAGTGPELPLPYIFQLKDGFDQYKLKLIAQDFSDKKAKTHSITLEHPKSVEVYSNIWDDKDKKMEKVTEKKVLDTNGDIVRVKYTYTFANTGKYKVKVRVKNAGEKLYNTTAAEIRIIK